MTNDERMQRESSLIATIRKKLPEFAKACAEDSELVLLHQDAFAADYFGDLGSTSHPARDAALGDVVAEHEQFAVDARSAPSWILRYHLENQFTDLFRDRPSADWLTYPGEEPPIQSEAGTMPAHNCIRCHDNERISTRTKGGEGPTRTTCPPM
jgi:hypothetical protein